MPRLLTVCAWCRKPLRTDFMPDQISHGICPKCEVGLMTDAGLLPDPSVWQYWQDEGGEG